MIFFFAVLQLNNMLFSATVGMNIITVVLLYMPTLSGLAHVMLVGPNFALENSMASRVHRMLKFDTRRSGTEPLDGTIVFAQRPSDPEHGPVSALIWSKRSEGSMVPEVDDNSSCKSTIRPCPVEQGSLPTSSTGVNDTTA
jgi:hypothetical protein